MVGSSYTSGTVYWSPSINSTTTGWTTNANCKWTYSYSQSDLEAAFYEGGGRSIKEVIPDCLPAGRRRLGLPDGSVLLLDDDGNYRIEDKDAKVTYKANRTREFSPYLNASDMVARFVSHVGSLGVKRNEVLGLPLHLFIGWLVMEAAERDGDEVPGDIVPVGRDPLVKSAIRPKCLACGRFIQRANYQNRFPFCNAEHGERFVGKRLKLIEAPA